MASRAESPARDLEEALAELRRRASPAHREGLKRFAILIENAIGVSMVDLKAIAKPLRKRHDLALALWAESFYEARLLAALVDDPKQVSADQMERWAADFDNWGVCDTACFALFDRAPAAWTMLDAWAAREQEFVRRGAFALLASLSVHDKHAADSEFLTRLALIEAAADDPRNFVKKAVNWALRSIGKRSALLHASAVEVAQRLAVRKEASARWIGRDALRELVKPAMLERVARKAAR